MTIRNAGFHGANSATTAARISTGTTAAVTTNRSHADVGGIRMYYCYTHGLGMNSNHTSQTCSNPNATHQREATVDNMQGGNNTIMLPRPRRPTPGRNA